MKPYALLLVLATAVAHSQDVPAHFQEVANAVGKAGTLNADGSYRINIARTDVKFTNAAGMSIPADMGLSTYIAMSGNAEKVLAVGDVAMLDDEIDRVIDALRAGGCEIVALHNHMTSEQPRLFYMHFQATGAPAALAKTFRSAIDILGTPTQKASPPNSGKPKLDQDALATVFETKPQVFPSGVLRWSSPRKDLKAVVDEQSFLPGMGLSSWATFNACECGLTMVMGDTCCVRADLQQAIDAYRRAGIHITGIHNHTLGGSPQVMFMHYEGEGDASALAQGIKECWNLLGH